MKKTQLVNMKINSILGEEKKVLNELSEQLANYSFLKEDCEEFKVALAEICINAIEHGNQEIKQKQVHIIVTLEGEKIQSEVMDDGMGFVFEEKENSERGWGLKIVQQFVDGWTMYQNCGTNRKFSIRLEKRLRAKATVK